MPKLGGNALSDGGGLSCAMRVQKTEFAEKMCGCSHTHTRDSRPQAPERGLNPRRLLRTLLCLACPLLTAFWSAPTSRGSDAPGSNLATFRMFVNGEIPIKEAVVHRTLKEGARALGDVRWRFSLQDGGRSWYVQVLDPPDLNHRTFGASLAQLWEVGDKTLHVVDKGCAKGSEPYGASFQRTLLWNTVALGLPSDWGAVREAPVKSVTWAGDRFEAMQSVPGEHGLAAHTRSVRGRVKLKNGRPIEALNESGRILAVYEYRGAGPIPSAWTETTGPYTVQFEFEGLELGTNALCGAKGFLPGSFATSANPHCYIWTNDVAYGVTDSGLWRTSDAIRGKPRRTGLVAMVAIVAATLSCLFAYYVIQRKRKVR